MISSHKHRWWQPEAFAWSGMELFVMRLGFAILFFANVRWETSIFTEQPSPNGLAHYFDLTWVAEPPPGWFVQGGVIAGLILYVFGRFSALGLLPIVFFATIIGTLANSQGAINHSQQMVTMMGIAQCLVYAWPRRSGWHIVAKADTERHRQAAYAAIVVIAASYVVCGVVKMVRSDGLWLHNAPFIAVQLYKTHFSNFYDTLEMPPEWLQKITELLVQNPNLSRLVFGTGLLIELAAFVILINRRWAFAGGIAIIALHLSISRLMNLNFEAHIFAVLIYTVNLPGLKQMWRGRP